MGKTELVGVCILTTEKVRVMRQFIQKEKRAKFEFSHKKETTKVPFG